MYGDRQNAVFPFEADVLIAIPVLVEPRRDAHACFAPWIVTDKNKQLFPCRT
jgi:hypothetical protein